MRSIVIAFAMLVPIRASASDITIPLAASASVERTTAEFRCDAVGTTLGLPAAPFLVEYITGGGNALAVLPIEGKPLVFANVLAASGARYAAGSLIWWDARGHSITLTGETVDGKKQSDCQLVDKK